MSSIARLVVNAENDANHEVQHAALRQNGVTMHQPHYIFERLASIWLMQPLGGSKAVSSLRLCRLNEPRPSSNLWRIFMGDTGYLYGFMAGSFNVGLISRAVELPDNAPRNSALDRQFNFFAAFVDRLAVMVDIQVLWEHYPELCRLFSTYCNSPLTNGTQTCAQNRKKR